MTTVGDFVGDEDLKVDYLMLEDSESKLKTLKSEFDTIEKHRDETEDIWGHHDVKEAMDDFASNMDYHRKKLSEKLQVVGEKVTNTLETFREAETELAKSFEES